MMIRASEPPTKLRLFAESATILLRTFIVFSQVRYAPTKFVALYRNQYIVTISDEIMDYN
jgi:hypothetical protein